LTFACLGSRLRCCCGACSSSQQFLDSIGLLEFWPKFRSVGISSLEELLDPANVDDNDLIANIGMRRLQVKQFRKTALTKFGPAARKPAAPSRAAAEEEPWGPKDPSTHKTQADAKKHRGGAPEDAWGSGDPAKQKARADAKQRRRAPGATTAGAVLGLDAVLDLDSAVGTSVTGSASASGGGGAAVVLLSFAEFLVDAKLEKHQGRFEEMGITDLEMLADPDICDDPILKDVGLSKVAIRKLRGKIEARAAGGGEPPVKRSDREMALKNKPGKLSALSNLSVGRDVAMTDLDAGEELGGSHDGTII